jgi:large conductance mechanosensitive channel
MSIIQEFKTFALKGNMIDLAIGVIIGAAFGKVVSSLVDNVIMPPIGLLVSGIDFNSLQIVLKKATADQAAVAIKYGTFINTLIYFFIVAIVIFFVIKGMNKLRRTKPAEPTEKECKECLSSIPKQAKKCKYCSSTQ